MKKTYINPETIVVRLMPTTVLAASPLSITNNGDTAPLINTSATSGVDAMTKGTSDVNVWDEEW